MPQAFTVSQLLTRFRTVLEGSTCNLKESRDAFSHDRQPNALLHDVYHLEDGGIISSRSVTNYDLVRIERVIVWVTKRLAFDGATALAAMEDLMKTIEIEMVEDGVAQGYNVNIENRRITRPEDRDYCIGSLSCSVDHDADES